MAEDETALVLPNVEQAACRALSLAALVGRSRFEEYVEAGMPMNRLEEMDASLRRWLDEEGVDAHLSGRERVLLSKPLGSWTRQERVDGGWRAESLGVLLWAIGTFSTIPPYDEEFSHEDVLEATGLYDFRPAADLMALAWLRPADEIEDARSAAELWHWRARATAMQARRVELPEGRTWRQVIASAAATAHRNGWASHPVDGDFPLSGRAYSEAAVDARRRAWSVASERHWALNWLRGMAGDWDEVPLDT